MFIGEGFRVILYPDTLILHLSDTSYNYKSGVFAKSDQVILQV
jgi:hypothetical protein